MDIGQVGFRFRPVEPTLSLLTPASNERTTVLQRGNGYQGRGSFIIDKQHASYTPKNGLKHRCMNILILYDVFEWMKFSESILDRIFSGKNSLHQSKTKIS